MRRDGSRRASRRLARAGVTLALLLVAVAGVLAAFPGAGLGAWRLAAVRWHGVQTGETIVMGRGVAWAERGKGPPIVLVHGLRGELTIQLPLARALADRGYRVVAIDLPGHGHSEAPKEPLDIASAGRVVLEVSRAVGAERPVLVGHSLGGWIVGWQSLAEPECCRAAVMMSTAGLPFELPAMSLLVSRTTRDARRSADLLFAEPPRIVPSPILWFAVQRPHESSLDLLRSALSGRYLLDGLVSAATVPTLLLFGEQDRLIPPDVGQRLAASHPEGRYVGIAEAGHMVVWERPEAVAGAIDEFVAGLDAPVARAEP